MTEVRIPDYGQSIGGMCLWLEQMGLFRPSTWEVNIDVGNDQYVFEFKDDAVATMFALRWS